MRLLDTFCKAGGASMGFHLAGFDVVGVDIHPQPNYPFEFIQADALEVLADRSLVATFDALAGGPPCQAHTLAQRIQQNEHPDLIPPVRQLMRASGLPYVIENVPGAPLLDPVEVCGCMFPGLRVYRERLFEIGGWTLTSTAIATDLLGRPVHQPHREPVTKMGRPPREGERMHVVGNFSGVAAAREAMGISWMTRDELREAIPPAYTKYIGEALMAHLGAEVAA